MHLKVDGVLVADQDEKARAVDAFYEQLLGSSSDRGFTLDLDYLGMQMHDLVELEAPFSDEEVWGVIKAQEFDKASGPDGFTGRFYTSCWGIIKPDVMDAFQTLWQGDCRGMHVANQALISLLPKHVDAVEVKYFRLISLIHSVAKLVAKLVQCTARHLNALKSPTVMFKLDITKAFDMVDWAFLLHILAKQGFGPQWISMVVGLLNTASTRVLVNGVAGDLIYNRHGLRQGDPLSPLLFDSIMEVLHLLLQKAASDGLLSDLAPRGLRYCTSMYADDVVTFLKPERLHLLACAAIVEDFGEASGLRTNRAKCSLHPICCSPERVEMARSILQCIVEEWPCKYLGLPLGLRGPASDHGGERGQPATPVVRQVVEPGRQDDSCSDDSQRRSHPRDDVARYSP
ncbi:hypothetical protein ACQ4PT_042573 [Festuca glaucescens]